jgi:hypothetical protein
MGTRQTQQGYLRVVKDESGLDWDTFAVHAGIAPRAMKAYRLPKTSPGYRGLPDLARAAIEHFRSSAGRDSVMSQQDFLLRAKTTLGLGWDELAVQAGISPRAMKNWRLPATSSNHRTMPNLARAAIDRQLQTKSRPRRKKGA